MRKHLENLASEAIKSSQNEEIVVNVRPMKRRHIPEVLAIEAASFEFPWLEDDFICSLKRKKCKGRVAEYQGRVIGSMIYELHKSRIHVLNFAVLPEYRREGVGSQMLAKLTAKLSSQRRSRVVLEVRETNLPAQLFFRENGFRAVSTLHGYYSETSEDAYIMEHRYGPKENVSDSKEVQKYTAARVLG